MIDRYRYELIKNKYGQYASWAIWKEWKPSDKPKSGMGDISFFDNPSETLLNTLKPNIVLVGLNISRKIERPLGNFHPLYSDAQDYKTRYALQGTPLWGAYMTDIIKDFEQKISGKVISYLNKEKEFEKANIILFKEELNDLGVKNPTIIAFGKDSYEILIRNLDDQTNILSIPHYSNYFSKESYREQVITNIKL